MTSLLSLITANLTLLTPTKLGELKKICAKALGKTPRDSDLRAAYLELIKQGVVESDKELLRTWTTREIRTLSGVTPFAVMMKAYTCPGLCTFCPLELGMPKSYLSDEPAAARAKMMDFDPRKQIESRLQQLEETLGDY